MVDHCRLTFDDPFHPPTHRAIRGEKAGALNAATISEATAASGTKVRVGCEMACMTAHTLMVGEFLF